MEACCWRSHYLLVSRYSRYALSYRDLKEIAEGRDFNLNQSTIFRCVQEHAHQSCLACPALCKKHNFNPVCDFTGNIGQISWYIELIPGNVFDIPTSLQRNIILFS